MKHSFDLDNFESFLSEQADRHRMYPGDRVWRNIQENLHGTSRWPALTFGAILTMATLAIVLTITYPNRNLLENNPVAVKGSSLSHVPMVNNAVPLVAKNSGNHAAPHSLGHIPLKEPVMLQSKANAANEIEPVQSNPVGSAEVAHLENAEEALNAERPDKSVISSGFEENTTTGTSDNKKPLTLASEVSTTHGLDIQPANTPEKFEYAAS
ncbi:MAG: hypothetical protein MUE99_02585, partial [Chitinophagaceae bacterium]|nr:hypothetical protein [Chitinophagaceae bacterium]